MLFYILLFAAIFSFPSTFYGRKIDDNWALANGFVSLGAQKTLYSSTIALYMGFHYYEDY